MNIDDRASRLFSRLVPDPSAAFNEPLVVGAQRTLPFDPATLRDGCTFAASGPLAGFPVVLLNGPPHVGKDTAGRALERSIYGTQTLKFAEAAKRGTHALYGLQVGPNHYEATKDTPSGDFNGLSPRAAYIMFSERMTKPNLGIEHFGFVMTRTLRAAKRTGARVAAITDSGFASEVGPVAEAVGLDAVLLLRLHRTGCTYEGDSRGYLDLPGVATRDVFNSASETEFCAAVVAVVREWLDYRAGLV